MSISKKKKPHLGCRYQRSGDTGIPVLLVHGFGANADHWRKNTPVIGEWGRCWSIDLLGYGYSDKPDPSTQEKNAIYNFESWAGTQTMHVLLLGMLWLCLCPHSKLPARLLLFHLSRASGLCTGTKNEALAGVVTQ